MSAASRLGRVWLRCRAEAVQWRRGGGAEEHQRSTRKRPIGSERAEERGEAPDAGF